MLKYAGSNSKEELLNLVNLIHVFLLLLIHHLFSFLLSFSLFVLHKVPDGDTLFVHPTLEHFVVSPPVSVIVSEAIVVSKNPVVLILALLEESANLDGHQSGHLVLNRCHQRECIGLIGAGGVLAHGVGIVVGERDQNRAANMEPGEEEESEDHSEEVVKIDTDASPGHDVGNAEQ